MLRGLPFMGSKPETRTSQYWYKMQAASDWLYTLAHPEIVTSIQYVEAIGINVFIIETNCLVVAICIYVVQKTSYVINF